MKWFSDAREERISFPDIDFINLDYHVCKPPDRDRLRKCIQRFGVPVRPVCIKGENGWIVLSGHEELTVCRELGLDHCDAFCVDSLPWDDYARYLLWHNLHNELTALGKLRVLALADQEPENRRAEVNDLLREGLQIPEYFLSSEYLSGWVNSLPVSLTEYLHNRDAGFKVLKNLHHLPFEVVKHISCWIDGLFFKFNIFRDIVDMALDVFRRDGNAEAILAINPEKSTNPRIIEEYLQSGLQRVRYPRYHELKTKTDSITSILRGRGIEATVPPFFEGNAVNVSVRIEKRQDMEKIKEQFSRALDGEVRELMNLL